MSKNIWHDEESKLEILFTKGDDECFLTVARHGDDENEDRVTVLNKKNAYEAGLRLLKFAMEAP